MTDCYTIIYFDEQEQEHEVHVQADDAAAALGVVLHEHGDEIAVDSPFAVYLKGTDQERQIIDLPEDLSTLLKSTGCGLDN